MDADNSTAVTADRIDREIQKAHYKYFEDLNAAWNTNVLEFHFIQNDLGRGLEQAWLKRDPKAWQSAVSDYQRAFQTAADQTILYGRYDEALRRYKQTVLEAIGGAKPDDLSFTDLAVIAHSFSAVSHLAWALAQEKAPVGSADYQ